MYKFLLLTSLVFLPLLHERETKVIFFYQITDFPLWAQKNFCGYPDKTPFLQNKLLSSAAWLPSNYTNTC